MKKSAEFLEYARLIVKKGVNLQEHETLAISADIEAAHLVEAVCLIAYQNGAKNIIINWTNAHADKLHYIHQSIDNLIDTPKWKKHSFDYIAQNAHAYLNIICEHPKLFETIDKGIMQKSRACNMQSFKSLREAVSSDKIRWCIAAFPNAEWAQKVFPDDKNAEKKLWDCIQKAVRLDNEDCLAAWDKHVENIKKRSKVLNELKIKTVHIKNSLGTDIKMNMLDGYSFGGGMGTSPSGIDFIVNLPTEEIGTTPDYKSVEGIVFSSMPLAIRGSVINDFWFRFEKGEVVDFGAKEGYEVLKGILETDEGARRLGEVSFVGHNDGIGRLGIVFYNILFDENASCHLALGRGSGGGNLSEEERLKKGINQSIEHVDFMIGTADLSVVAECEDEKKVAIFKNGNWVI